MSVPGNGPSLQPFVVDALFGVAVGDAPAMADKRSECFFIMFDASAIVI